MANFTKFIENFDPHKDAGGVLLILNVLGMIFAAASNTFAAAKDKNTSAQDKKFLVPAGVLTGFANIGTYFVLTKKIIKELKNVASNVLTTMEPDEISKNTLDMVKKNINKSEHGLFNTGILKKSDEYIASMKSALLENGKVTEYAKDLYKNNMKEGAGVLGAFIGAVIGCAILTPIIRDISAYIVQKKMEKQNPDLQNKPYRPYFDPAHIESGRYGRVGKQPLSMKSYMAFTNGSMKI